MGLLLEIVEVVLTSLAVLVSGGSFLKDRFKKTRQLTEDDSVTQSASVSIKMPDGESAHFKMNTEDAKRLLTL